MTRKVFWEDPYCAQLDVTIVKIEENDVSVDRTIFYPFSGGQERDHGTLGDKNVLEVNKVGKDLVYKLENVSNLRVGEVIPMKIDWKRRYLLMRYHFAAELVLETAYRTIPSLEKIGAHIAADKARIDFLWKENLAPQLPVIEGQVNQMIAEDREIISAYSDEETERRYWEVPGFARVACGGTHLRRTGEVGGIALRRDNIGRGKERVEIRLRN